MLRIRPPYPLEFRTEAVRLVRSSGTLVREVAADLGVSEQTLRNWVRQCDLDAARCTDGAYQQRAGEVASCAAGCG